MRYFVINWLVLISFYASSQDQFPSSIKWKQIATSHFKLVYPDGIKQKADSVAILLENLYQPISHSLNTKPSPIPLLLHNQTVISNGFVTLAPRYMCFYTTPPQDASISLDATDWMQLLSAHEFRHVSQFSKLDTSFTNAMGSVFGDYGKLVCMYLSTPMWFFEGDAIVAETSILANGRGRLPAFFRANMANEIEFKRYSYDKALLGSYRQFVPNHYHLGYLLTNYVNRSFGGAVWNQILNHTSSQSYYPFAFSRGLQMFTGSNLNSTYSNAMNDYRGIWNNEIAKNASRFTESNTYVNSIYRCWTEQIYPFATPDNKIVAFKYGLEDIGTLMLLDGEHEHKLTNLSPIDRIHSAANKIVWAQTIPDLRWGERSFADIQIFDITTQTKKRLTKKQKLFAPAISNDGKLIVAIEFLSDEKCQLVILDAKTGKTIHKYPLKSDLFYRMPSWSVDQKEVTMTATSGQLKTLVVYNLETQKQKTIIPLTAENITNPVFYNEYILFNTGISGFDEIHAIDTTTLQRFILLSSPYGVYNPQVAQKGDIVYQKYTVNGTRVRQKPLNKELWKPLDLEQSKMQNYLQTLSPTDTTLFAKFSNNHDTNYIESDYSPILHALNVHSWNPKVGYRSIGFNVYSNDILNTTSLKLGIDYYPKDYAHREYATILYSHLYPIFGMEFSYGQKYQYLADTSNISEYRKMDEKVMDFSIALPFNLSRGVYTTNLVLKAGYLYSWQHFDADTFYLSNQTQLISGFYSGFEFSSLRDMAPRNLFPRVGQELTLNSLKSTLSTDSYQVTGRSKTYLPGIARNQSTQVTFAFDNKKGDYFESIYLLKYSAEPVRGYESPYYESAFRATFNYATPLLYPDLALGPIIYFRRIYMNAFYDWGNYKAFNQGLNLQSVGCDLNFEVSLFRLPVSFEMGLRYAYRMYDNTNAFEFILFGVPF